MNRRKIYILTFIVLALFFHARQGKAETAEDLIKGSDLVGEQAQYYSGSVLSVEKQPDGSSRIALRARSRDVNDPHTLNSLGDESERARPIQKDSYTLHWTQAEKPVPFFPGLEIGFAVNNDKVVEIWWRFDEYLALRKQANGTVEVVIGHGTFDNYTGKRDLSQPKVYVVPDDLNLEISYYGVLTWTERDGVTLNDGKHNLGDAGDEAEQLRVKKEGWQMVNDPTRWVVPGREGWVLYEKISPADRLDYEAQIPASQHRAREFQSDRISAAGQKSDRATAETTGADEFARGEALRKGDGVSKNLAAAVNAYQRAAAAGNGGAMHRLGVMRATGEGLSQDFNEAAKWYIRAAEAGFAEAQYDLGVCYIKGRGVPKDEIKGIQLYHDAARQNYQEAIDALRARGVTP